MNIISITNLSKQFGRKKVLKNLDLEIKKGQFLTVFGPNGAGKTTLMKILATLMRPTKGEFTVNDYEIIDESGDIRQSIGMISHSPFLYDDLTALENLLFYGNMFKLHSDKLQTRAKSLLKQVDLFHRSYDKVETFSRGMKQRLSIARATIHSPKVLLLDEPFTGLDPKGSKMLEDILMDFKRKGGTLIMATHNLERGLRLSDRVIILIKGTIQFDSSARKLNLKKLNSTYQDLTEDDNA
jgi:heme ABC exporter ATP-binding subunit CcmA